MGLCRRHHLAGRSSRAWTAIALNYSYSHGDRAGYIQKFSRKGWICKTWEGELAMVNVPGAVQERLDFTVRNDSIAAAHQLDRWASASRSPTSSIEGVPTSCFGETEYFVDRSAECSGSDVPTCY